MLIYVDSFAYFVIVKVEVTRRTSKNVEFVLFCGSRQAFSNEHVIERSTSVQPRTLCSTLRTENGVEVMNKVHQVE